MIEKEQIRIFHCLYNDKIIGTKAVPLPRRMGTIAAPAEKKPGPPYFVTESKRIRGSTPDFMAISPMGIGSDKLTL